MRFNSWPECPRACDQSTFTESAMIPAFSVMNSVAYFSMYVLVTVTVKLPGYLCFSTVMAQPALTRRAHTPNGSTHSQQDPIITTGAHTRNRSPHSQWEPTLATGAHTRNRSPHSQGEPTLPTGAHTRNGSTHLQRVSTFATGAHF